MTNILNSNKSILRKFKLVVFLTLLISLFLGFNSLNTVFAADVNISDIKINSRAAILIDGDTGDILYSKNSNSKVYPASTTKILTAILAIEKLDLDSTVIVSKSAIDIPYGSSNANLKLGEVISVKDLLYCLLLKSGNDSANVLAEAVSGTNKEFIVLMNEKLKELELTGTNFTNSHGYHDKNHYTTASDMMKILKYCLKNETFKSILMAKTYTVKPTNKTIKERILKTTNRLILTKYDSYLSDYYEYCLGGKTGFTTEAGRTFVAFGKKGNRNVILGTFDVKDVGLNDLRDVDAKKLFEYGFNKFENINILKKNDFKFEYIDKNINYKYVLGINDDVYLSVKKYENLENKLNESIYKSNISIENNIDKALLNKYTYDTTQNNACQVIGNININFVDNSGLYQKEVPLILLEKSKIGFAENLKKVGLSVFKIILYLLIFFLSILIILIIVLLIRKKLRKNKRLLYTKTSRRNRIR